MLGANPPGWAYPGQGYAGTTTATQEYTDSATITVALSPSVAEVFEGADFYTAYVDVQPDGTEFKGIEYADSGTAYVDMQSLGGECYSTFSGLYLDGEAYPRWNSSENVDRWSETEDCRWLAGDAEQLHPIEGDAFFMWIPVDQDCRWAETEDCRWLVTSVLSARLCD